ncbi:malto-oligosyltrehalose synthase [Streptomyces sp. NBC_01304]|uniref:malto-oligosyltrehalose synthase n=1 Tax=Streptomyces sp. NBC_01304 TaxID=2903818 RepID=UPI002E11E42E|nr:malto-oligosyltrehalose synthase [Streptomyces sp. NBC_01304]
MTPEDVRTTPPRPIRNFAPPTATYRLQLSPAFPFAAAAAAVPYLAGLGVSHLHLSPVLEAVPGSAHGYDVVDHARVRGELGGEEGLRALSVAARAHGLGLVVDIVPNHMAAAPRHNRALWDVLRRGPHSPYARWFDIDWQAGGGRVLLPVLAHRLGAELGQLQVTGGVLRYGDHEFPLREGSAGLPLPELLEVQWYRLGWWRLARTELNYRRFFTISDLIGVRVEDPEVFDATHAKILELVRDGVVDGLRVDHPDGLADPGAYLRKLDEETGGRWTVVEKILADGEQLPAVWPVAGSTGYDALRHIDGLFVDPEGVGELLGRYRAFASPESDRGGHWGTTVRRAAYKVVTHELAAEVDRLVRAADVCAELHDHAPWALRAALRELLVRLPVYRPYGAGDADRAVLTDRAAEEARSRFAVPEEAQAVDYVRELLLGGSGTEEAEVLRARFAQTASALRAKAVEDTACFRYVPLLSAAEVGGSPGAPALAPEAFHAFCTRLQRDWPATGTVLSTHDTKRSADVRAGTAVLSECPDRWGEFLDRVTAAMEQDEEGHAPDRQLAWATWQTAVGAGPLGGDRLRDAMLKHAREAGLYTGWTEPDAVYEQAVAAFVAAGPCGALRGVVESFRAELAPHTRANVLGAALLHLTMPGVPDLYQGTEQVRCELVDPDNRRPVSFEPAKPEGLDAEKPALTTTALRLRRGRPEVFGESATYEPLRARGPAADHCVAFARSGEVITAVTRLSLRLARAGGWRDTSLSLPEGRYVDVLAAEGESVREFSGHTRVAEIFEGRPVALLVRLREERGGGGVGKSTGTT